MADFNIGTSYAKSGDFEKACTILHLFAFYEKQGEYLMINALVFHGEVYMTCRFQKKHL